jgi:hypothetical protein
MHISTRSFGVLVVAAVFAVVVVAPGMARAEEVDNPQYQSWAKFKPGSTRTLVGEMSAQGMPMQMEMTSTLKDVTPDEATISTRVTMHAMGEARERPAQERPVRAKMEKQDIQPVGEEAVEAAGKTYKCKIYDVQSESPMGGRARGQQGESATKPAISKSRIWVSPEVPGGLVKMIVPTPAGQMTVTLKSFEAK